MALGTDPPRLVPVRMLNEFTYCKRLFHLEWVQSEWASNVYTDDGDWQHRVVDAPGGKAPSAKDSEELKSARSVEISSEELGLIGKIDLLEPDDGRVLPIDYKRGTPPDVPEGAHLPERVQVCAQGMLLRAAGYEVSKGSLYFVAAKQRVDVLFDDDLVETTFSLLDELRTVAESPVAPPPLEDSSKCPNCSLVGICMPDETNALINEEAVKPRRLIPSDDAARPVNVTEQGVRAAKSKGRLELRRKRETLLSVRLIDVSQLNLFGNIQVSTQLMRELFRRDIPVMWFSYGGWFSGIAHGMPGKNVELRLRQAQAVEEADVSIPAAMIEAKILNSRTLVMRNARIRPKSEVAQMKVLAAKAREASSAETLLGIEGAAARTYFSVFNGMIRAPGSRPLGCFQFEGRNRRPPADPVNCLLSFCYALLVKDCTATLLSVGFDPYMGVYHRPRFGRPALALDMAEEFRPLIAESVVLTCINNGEVSSRDFIARAGGVALTSEGRKSVISAFERRMAAEVRHPSFGYTITYRRVLEVQARLLGSKLKGEIEDYPGFVTR